MVRAAVVIPPSQAALAGRLWFYTASGSGRGGTLNVYDMALGSCLVRCGPAMMASLPLQHLRCLHIKHHTLLQDVHMLIASA